MQKIPGYLALSLALVVSGPALSAGDAAAGKSKSTVCAGCHGADGNSVNPVWPKLAGQNQAYLVKQLKEFKSGKRNNAIMSVNAAPLSEQDMADLSAFYAGQTGTTAKPDAALVALGEKIYRGGNKKTGVPACMGCHGPAGSGNPAAAFPALAGQHAQYTASTLREFQQEKRANDINDMMRMTAAKMSQKEIDAVSNFIAGLYQ